MFYGHDFVQFTKKTCWSILIGATFFIQLIQPVVASLSDSGDIINYKHIHHPVIGRGGMVTTQHHLATQTGVHILKQGGNAVDAAVAVGFALAVTLPRAGNIGGGGFMLVHHAATQQTLAFDYYGQAPSQLTPAQLIEATTQPRSIFSHQVVAIPGTVAGLWEVHQRFGTLPWTTLVEPAIKLAREGMPLTFDEARALQQRKSILIKDPSAAKTFFKPNGDTYQAGDCFKQSDLAWSLTQIRDGGKDAFYRGQLGQRLIQGIQQQGGLLTVEDLAHYTVKVGTPIWSRYRTHYHIASMPSPAAGIILASIMNILEQFPLNQLGANTADSIHILAEAFKLSRYNLKIPACTFIQKSFAIQRAQRIHLKRTLNPEPIESTQTAAQESADTTHYTIADAAGNVVSNTYTLSDSFGAHVVAPGTGILLNNTLKNLACLSKLPKANKQNGMTIPYQGIPSAITPVIVFKNNKPWLATGSLGGSRIPGVLAQLLVNIIDHRLNPAEATMRPRMGQLDADTPLVLEHSFSNDVMGLLRARGHRIKWVNTMGGAQSILMEHGLFQGAADTRRPDSSAMAVY